MSVASADNDNANANSDKITFNIKDTKLYVPVVTLPEKLSKLLSKGFERSVYWNEYLKKSEKNVRQMNIDIFSNQILLEVICFGLFKSRQLF